MMRIAVLLLLWAVCATLTLAHAEVIELEGTVKAVDAEARTISIERKTAKGTKTLDLEVNKKAGDLSSLEVGDKISFSYDPDLELVTKIGRVAVAGGGADSNEPAKTGKLTCRASFRFNVCERRLKSAARGGRKVQRWGWVESTPG